MRLCNSSGPSLADPLRYPEGITVEPPMPITRAGVLRLTGV